MQYRDLWGHSYKSFLCRILIIIRLHKIKIYIYNPHPEKLKYLNEIGVAYLEIKEYNELCNLINKNIM